MKQINFTACALFSLLVAFAEPLLAGQNRISSQALETADGVAFDALHASADKPEHGIVLVHDWFGISPYYRESVEKLAAAGYYVLAVDLYDGSAATTHKDAWNLMSALDQDLAAAKVDAAIELLKRQDLASSATFGFSMGAPLALAASLRHSESIKATGIFYGDTINDPELLASLGGPVLLVVGSMDGNSSEAAAVFSKATDEAGQLAEVFIYPGAQHAFAQPLFNQGTTYDPVAAEVAWGLAINFFARRLH